MGELLLLHQPDNLLHQVSLESAADAAVLHPHHRLVRLDQVRRVDQAFVNVQLRHVVHNDRALEVCVLVLVLENELEQSGFAGAEEAAEKGDRNTGVPSEGVFLGTKVVSDKK